MIYIDITKFFNIKITNFYCTFIILVVVITILCSPLGAVNKGYNIDSHFSPKNLISTYSKLHI